MIGQGFGERGNLVFYLFPEKPAALLMICAKPDSEWFQRPAMAMHLRFYFGGRRV